MDSSWLPSKGFKYPSEATWNGGKTSSPFLDAWNIIQHRDDVNTDQDEADSAADRQRQSNDEQGQRIQQQFADGLIPKMEGQAIPEPGPPPEVEMPAVDPNDLPNADGSGG